MSSARSNPCTTLVKMIGLGMLFFSGAAAAKASSGTHTPRAKTIVELTHKNNILTAAIPQGTPLSTNPGTTYFTGKGNAINPCTGKKWHIGKPVKKGLTDVAPQDFIPADQMVIFHEGFIPLQVGICEHNQNIQLLKDLTLIFQKPTKLSWLAFTLDGTIYDLNSEEVIKQLIEGTDYRRIVTVLTDTPTPRM